MLAAAWTDALPGDAAGIRGQDPSVQYSFEPKWDGFRALLFRDGDAVVVQGRSGEDLAYAFPEVVAACREELPERIVIDGELIVISGERLDFEALGARIRPRSEAGGASIAGLAESSPAAFVAFDALALGDVDLLGEPNSARREILVEAMSAAGSRMRLTPQTPDPVRAREWFAAFEGAGLDGLIARDPALPYRPGKRVLGKIKHRRTADVVVAGFRRHSSDANPGSLLLGLHDDDARLHHIGVASGFSARRRAELAVELAPYALAEGASHPWIGAPEGTRVPGGVNRWSRGRDSSWTPLRPDLVAEVGYDQMEGDRLRHVASLQRWRPDRDPASCRYGQDEPPPPLDVRRVLDGRWDA